MNLSKLPLTGEFALAWEHDGKLDRERFDAEHAGDVANNVPEPERRLGFNDRYLHAARTGDWKSLCKPDESPTLIWFRHVTGETRDRLKDLDVGGHVRAGLAFRLGFARIENGPTGLAKITRTPHPEFRELGLMLNAEVYDQLSGIRYQGSSLVLSLGWGAFLRGDMLDPLS